MSDVVITVRGEHEARVAPEEATAHLSVRAEGPERGGVVERIAALAGPLRDDLAERKTGGAVREWTSQRVSVWANRPWNSEGKQLALVHYASVQITATFTDIAALSWWLTDVAERDGVQVDGISWDLTSDTRRAVEADVATEAVQVAIDRATAYAKALGFAGVEPVEIADLGMIGQPSPRSAAPEMFGMAKASFASDAGAPALDFQPDDIVVRSGVEARFTAR